MWFGICESRSGARLLTKPSMSVTSQAEKLPDVVPDQSRITEEETTEVGAVCMSLSADAVNNHHHR